ncbi:MAG TPA: class I SAM-dependent methyltransferase [Kofleriaceae bacterium]|nr:class I SAM-dependent methyltransferase [Kofleriaceae bacterium]
MSFADHFSSVAARYAAFRPRYPAALVDLLATNADPAGVVWDVGCGNGQLSVALAERFPRVIATDPAQAQLAAAIAHPRVEYRRSSAEDSGLPTSSVSLVVAAQAAHWFDWPRFLVEAARVAVPGALVALVSYGNLVTDGPPDVELRRYNREIAGPYWPRGREHVENGYRDLVMPWPAVEAPLIDMTADWTRDEVIGYVSSWSATARLVEREGQGPFDAFCARLAATWPDGERRRVRWPLAIHLARR